MKAEDVIPSVKPIKLERDRARLDPAKVAVIDALLKFADQDQKRTAFADKAAGPASPDLLIVFTGIYRNALVGHYVSPGVRTTITEQWA